VVVIATLVFAIVRRNVGLRRGLRLTGAAVALVVLIAGSFHLHVYNELRNGHVLASVENAQLRFSTAAGAPKEDRSVKAAVRKGIEQATTVWSGLWASFAEKAHLGGFTTLLLAVAYGIGLLGIVIGGRVFDPSGRAVALLAVAVGGVTWLAMALQWSYSQVGRFLLPTAVTVLCAVVLGTAAVIDRVRPSAASVSVAAGAWIVVLLALNGWALVRVA
jgi:hypothetical protein